MKVKINGRTVAYAGEAGDTLGALLDSLRRAGEIAGDQVVVALRVDDRPCTSEDLAGMENASLREAEEVLIVTDQVRGYARRILTDAGSMLSVLQEATSRVAEGFRGSAVEKANANLFSLLTSLQCFLACICRVDELCDLARAPLDPQRHLFAEVTDCLDRIQSSQEKQDWLTLAAQLELNLRPVLAGFEPVLQDMRDAVS